MKNSVKYCILDAARIGVQIRKALEIAGESESLYTGNNRKNLADVAPYLLVCAEGSKAERWIIGNGYGNNWGIFLDTDEDFQAVCKHLRKLLIVENQDGERLFFRYYDPRVIRDFLPTCSSAQVEDFFGNITKIFVENPDKGNFLVFTHKGGVLEINEGELGNLIEDNPSDQPGEIIRNDCKEESTII